MSLKLHDHILKVHKQFNLTTILVSHDFAEIYKMSSTILMIENGKIIKQGTTSEILLNEKTGDFRFTGEVISIEKHEMLYIVSIIVGDNVIKSTVSETEQAHLNAGDKVLISLQALN